MKSQCVYYRGTERRNVINQKKNVQMAQKLIKRRPDGLNIHKFGQMSTFVCISSPVYCEFKFFCQLVGHTHGVLSDGVHMCAVCGDSVLCVMLCCVQCVMLCGDSVLCVMLCCVMLCTCAVCDAVW